jgi:hypothetical protein
MDDIAIALLSNSINVESKGRHIGSHWRDGKIVCGEFRGGKGWMLEFNDEQRDEANSNSEEDR